VTERKRAEQARDDLFASLSHDLKSPLTVIQGQAQFMRRKLDRNPEPGGDGLKRGLEQINATSRAMATQITDLLEFTRQEMGGTIPAAPFDLSLLARERAGLLQQATEQHWIEVEVPPAGPVTLGDRRQLGSVIDNLLLNAIKYSPDGGTIAIDVTRERNDAGDWAVLAVRDHGIGIPADDLPRIFTSYHRGSNVGRIEGSGVGLAGAQRLVALHGGDIGAESSPAGGATFTVRLPLPH